MVRPVEDLLDEPWLNACRYQTAALAERAFDRVERRRRAPSYVTRAEIDGVAIVAAVALTHRAVRALEQAGWGGEPYELSQDTQALLLERIARLYDTQPPRGTIRRGPGAGVEPQPGGTVRPRNTPQG